MTPARDIFDAEALLRLWRSEYSDLPFEAVVKQDVLRQGLYFSLQALLGEFKRKDYFIFTFDRAPLAELPEHRLAPEEIRIATDENIPGIAPLRPTVISVRLNPQSPYRVDCDGEGTLVLQLLGETIARVEYPPIPAYYQQKYSFEKPISEIAPAIEWGYLVYLTVFRNCQYFGKDEECQFCDINHNWRQQKRAGRPYTGVKDPAHIAEALEVIADTDPVAKAFTITGGSVIGELHGKNEVDFYLQYPLAMSERVKKHFIAKLVVQAWSLNDCRRAYEAGIRIYHPNYEVWDKRLFARICPGKDRYIGRDNWIQRILSAAQIFGARNVIPNFVGGVEMADGVGFPDVESAVSSTCEGLDFFMSHGIVPRFTTWCPEPFTVLGESAPAPLVYYLLLLRNRSVIVGLKPMLLFRSSWPQHCGKKPESMWNIFLMPSRCAPRLRSSPAGTTPYPRGISKSSYAMSIADCSLMLRRRRRANYPLSFY
ncbi:MAG: radical SAM protein [Turneriella sp.]|nr:radical SAM protein [Turneriella sp.]